MTPDATDMDRLTLIVQRLSDADLILPEEAGALLQKIAAAGGTADRDPDVGGEELYLMLGALVQTNRQDISVSKSAQDIVKRILHETADPP